MLKLYFVLICSFCCGDDYLENFEDIIWQRRSNNDPPLNLFKSFFPNLKNYENKAKVVTEADYPWIARVIHSRSIDKPHVCTAVCVVDHVFISAHRCISILKVSYTRIMYNNQILSAKAFVMPSNKSKQSYDDISFIVVNKEYKGDWHTVSLFNINRTDSSFKWYARLDCNETHKAVGYAVPKNGPTPSQEYRLTELEVYIDMNICHEIFTFNYLMGSFRLPCYHSCTLEEYRRDEAKCDNYHGVEGGAVLNVMKNQLLGVATWGAYYNKYELPVGISVVNSESFFKDYACALKIKQDDTMDVERFYYQKLCDNPSERRFYRNLYRD